MGVNVYVAIFPSALVLSGMFHFHAPVESIASSVMLGSYVFFANATLSLCAPVRVKEIALTSSATASINTNASPLIRSKFLLDFFALISLLRYAGKPGGIAIVCAILGIMRPKDIAINIIYKIIQPNVKLFYIMTCHFARPVFAVSH